MIGDLDALGEERIVLVISKAKDYVKNNVEILKHLVNERGYSGVYVEIARPYETVKKVLEEEGIDTKKLFFIDCITVVAGGKSKRTEDALFIGSPTNLTEISIAMSQAVPALPGEKKFLFLDTLSTLLIYNKAVTVAKFAHFLTVKLREWKILGVLISLEKETDEKMISQLSQFADKVIYLTEEV